jgi:hypothetical protein
VAYTKPRNHGLKVATIADQLAVALSAKVPVNDPVEVARMDSFDAGEVEVSFCSRL